MEPRLTRPRSALIKFEIALSVVVLPAPLGPNSATIAPSSTSSDTPRKARMTSSYVASRSRTRRKVAPLALMTVSRVRAYLAGDRAIARRDALFLGVGGGPLVDQRPEQLIGPNPIADDVPLRPVPLNDLGRAAALVIKARKLERLHQAGNTDLLEALLVDFEVLQPPLPFRAV